MVQLGSFRNRDMNLRCDRGQVTPAAVCIQCEMVDSAWLLRLYRTFEESEWTIGAWKKEKPLSLCEYKHPKPMIVVGLVLDKE